MNHSLDQGGKAEESLPEQRRHNLKLVQREWVRFVNVARDFRVDSKINNKQCSILCKEEIHPEERAGLAIWGQQRLERGQQVRQVNLNPALEAVLEES